MCGLLILVHLMNACFAHFIFWLLVSLLHFINCTLAGLVTPYGLLATLVTPYGPLAALIGPSGCFLSLLRLIALLAKFVTSHKLLACWARFALWAAC